MQTLTPALQLTIHYKRALAVLCQMSKATDNVINSYDAVEARIVVVGQLIDASSGTDSGPYAEHARARRSLSNGISQLKLRDTFAIALELAKLYQAYRRMCDILLELRHLMRDIERFETWRMHVNNDHEWPISPTDYDDQYEFYFRGSPTGQRVYGQYAASDISPRRITEVGDMVWGAMDGVWSLILSQFRTETGRVRVIHEFTDDTLNALIRQTSDLLSRVLPVTKALVDRFTIMLNKVAGHLRQRNPR